eukprot:355172-Chlamydomonas_euryale.AAC.6
MATEASRRMIAHAALSCEGASRSSGMRGYPSAERAPAVFVTFRKFLKPPSRNKAMPWPEVQTTLAECALHRFPETLLPQNF